MSLLDEIEEHARDASERRAMAEAASRAEDELAAERARPLLQRVERYLRRAANALNGAEQPITASYQVPELGQFTGLRQSSYQVARDPEDEDALRFHFECTGARAVKAALPSEALARARETALMGAGLNTRRVAQGGERRVLVVEARVPVTLHFQRSGSGLKLRTRNLLAIESRSYSLTGKQVDDGFLEALLETVMRRGNRLAALSGDQISATERGQLRKELARSQRRRDAELGGVLRRALFAVTESFRRLVLRQ